VPYVTPLDCVPHIASLNRVPYSICLNHSCYMSSLNRVPYAIFTPRATCCLSKLCAIYYTFRRCAICRLFELVPCHIFNPFVPHVVSLHCVPYAIRLSRSCHCHPFLLSYPQFAPLLITVKLQRKCAVKCASVPIYVRDTNF